MKRKNFLLIFIIIPLIVNISAAGPSTSITESASTTILSVDPPNILDETLQVGNTFTVNLTVTDVERLGGWQVNMSWDPSILNWTDGWNGDFLQGNPSEEWYGRAYDDETQPFTQVTRNPTAFDPFMGNWTNPFRATGSDNQYATCATDGVEETYYNYNIPLLTDVTQVEVGLETKTTENETLQQDKIELRLSNDGGTTWGPVHTIDVYESEILWWEDVTSDFAWTPSMLSNANFTVKIRYKQVGAVASTIYLDWLPVRVTDSLKVENPVLARDNNLASYANFRYSQRSGSFSVLDFGYFLPGGSTPAEEKSGILQVDFHMKYAANASSSSDQYRIVYSAPVVSPDIVELEPWISSDTPLGTYSWLNQSDPNDDPLEPDTWGWEWESVAAIKFTVETNKVGGDPNAMFYEYEAWVTVTYLRPTIINYLLEQDAGWVLFTEYTDNYPARTYEGVSGSGWLGTFNFTVIGSGSTVLNITQTLTKLLDDSLPAQTIPFTPQNGYFSNELLGDADGDGDVDYDDLFILAEAYGSSSGQPAYDARADFDNDGDVDYDDLVLLAANYGKSV